jgi:hypothetical protein
MAEIFLSYRRQDSQSATGRLADRLEAHFGDARVFRDHEIAAGENFVEAIRRSVESSTVVLAIVGRRWLDANDAEGRRRLDDPADFVRLEIELALQARVPVVPVLVEGATMPAADELPPSLAGFARCQAVELSETRWQYDFDRLVATLQSRFGIESDRVALDSGAKEETRLLIRWGVDLIDLARHPQRLIARRQTGRASDPVRAFAFLCAALLVGNLMLLTVVDLDLVARGSLVEVVLGVASWLLTAVLLGLFVAGLLTGVLALAWRVADRNAGYRRVGLVAAYVYGGAWIGLCAFAVLAVTAVHLTDPGWLGRAVGGLHASMTASAPVAMPPMTRLDAAPMRGAASVLLGLGALVLVATAAWCVVAWGAFRQAFAATRLRSWLATSLWLALLAALVWLPLQLV